MEYNFDVDEYWYAALTLILAEMKCCVSEIWIVWSIRNHNLEFMDFFSAGVDINYTWNIVNTHDSAENLSFSSLLSLIFSLTTTNIYLLTSPRTPTYPPLTPYPAPSPPEALLLSHMTMLSFP